MSKPKAKTLPNASAVETENGAPVDFSDILDAEALSPFLTRLQAELGMEDDGTAYKVHIFKVTDEGKEARVWDGAPDEYDLMDLARRFGSGDYRVKLYGPQENGRVCIRANQLMPVLLSPEEDQAVTDRRNPAAKAETMNPQAIAQMIATAVAAAIPRPVEQPSPMEQLKTMAEVMRSLIPVPVAAPAGTDFMSMIHNFKAFQEVAKGMNGAPVDGDGKTDVSGHALTKGIDLVGKMMEASMQQRSGAAHSVSDTVNALPSPAATIEQTTEEIDEMNLKAGMLKLQLRALNRKAAGHANARTEAEGIYEDLPDDILEMLATDPKWFALLTELLPECAPHREWYELVRLRIVEMAREDGVLTPPVELRSVSANDPTIIHAPDAGSGSEPAS